MNGRAALRCARAAHLIGKDGLDGLENKLQIKGETASGDVRLIVLSASICKYSDVCDPHKNFTMLTQH